MRRAAHAFILFLCIIAAVAAAPVVLISAGAYLLDRDVSSAPEWWDRVSLYAIPTLLVAVVFLAWDSHRIARTEESGILVNNLRMPMPRKLRRQRRRELARVNRGRPSTL